MSAEMLPIDSVKLNYELFKRNVSVYDASINIGYTKNALKNAMARNVMSRRMLTGLWHCYHIRYDKFMPDISDEEPEKAKGDDSTEKTAENANIAVLDYVKLETLIRRAVAAALQDRGL